MEASWRRNHALGIMEEETWRGNHGGCMHYGGGIIEEVTRNHQEGLRRPQEVPGGTRGAPGKHSGGTQETPKRHPSGTQGTQSSRGLCEKELATTFS